jgi:hypothetical protein
MHVCVESRHMKRALVPAPSGSLARPRITAHEFEDAYAATAGTTVDQLHADGRAAEPCSCDWDLCRGWVLGYRHRPHGTTHHRSTGATAQAELAG